PFNIQYRVVGNQIVLSQPPAPSPTSEESAMNSPNFETVDRTVEGTILDENGGALPGVSIVLKGTTRGTTTDPNGKFSMSVPDQDAILVFSFVGYLSQEAVVGN